MLIGDVNDTVVLLLVSQLFSLDANTWSNG
jgi:hypothetical protein